MDKNDIIRNTNFMYATLFKTEGIISVAGKSLSSDHGLLFLEHKRVLQAYFILFAYPVVTQQLISPIAQ